MYASQLLHVVDFHLGVKRMCKVHCLHVPTLFAYSYKTFIASLIAFRVVANGMAAMAGFQAIP